jgi:hypothetical protein
MICIKINICNAVYKGCVSESGDSKNVINSKRFQLCSFNTYEHNVYIKAFWFFTVNTLKTKVLLPENNIIQMTTIPL